MSKYEYILSKAQKTIIDDNSRFRTLNAGRRFGKTHLFACEMLKDVATSHNHELIYLTPSYRMGKRIMLPMIKKLFPKEIIKNIDKTDLVIECINNNRIYMFGAQNYDSIRGSGYDYAIIDEVKDTPEEAFKEAIRPALSDKLGRCLVGGTPGGKNHWFYDLHMSEDFKHYTYTTLDGGRVPIEELEAAKRMLDEKTYRQEYEASFEDLTTSVYYSFSDENIVEDIRFDPYLTTYIAWDFNIGEQPLACLVIQESLGKNYLVKDLSFKHSNTEGTANAVLEYLKENNFSAQLYLTGDYAGNQRHSSSSRTDWDIIRHILREYRPIFKIRPTRSIRNRVACLNSLFRSLDGDKRLFINSSEKEVINDLRRLEWAENGTQFAKLGNKDFSHRPDALSYKAYNFDNVIEQDELPSYG